MLSISMRWDPASTSDPSEDPASGPRHPSRSGRAPRGTPPPPPPPPPLRLRGLIMRAWTAIEVVAVRVRRAGCHPLRRTFSSWSGQQASRHHVMRPRTVSAVRAQQPLRISASRFMLQTIGQSPQRLSCADRRDAVPTPSATPPRPCVWPIMPLHELESAPGVTAPRRCAGLRRGDDAARLAGAPGWTMGARVGPGRRAATKAPLREDQHNGDAYATRRIGSHIHGLARPPQPWGIAAAWLSSCIWPRAVYALQSCPDSAYTYFGLVDFRRSRLTFTIAIFVLGIAAFFGGRCVERRARSTGRWR